MSPLPFDQREGPIWMDGQIVDWKEARLHVLTHGLHYASCVFEGCRAYGGQIFKLQEHNERLHASARILGFEIPYSVEQLNEACEQMVQAHEMPEAYVRPVAWRGSEMMAISAQQTRIHVAVAVWDMGKYFSHEARMQGLQLRLADYRRPDPATAPVLAKAAGLYMICTIEKHKAEAEGFTDALFLDWRGYIAGATGANIFFVKGNEIHTPIADCFLDGITRRTVMELARDKGFTLQERRILPEEMADFEECFLTGTAAEVTPVARISDYHFTPGNVSQVLMQAYTKAVSSSGGMVENT